MTWDFAEANPFRHAPGSLTDSVDRVAKSLEPCPRPGRRGAAQADAATRPLQTAVLISTDPPYYDNIGYSDLSDFFYVWLRRSLRDIHPELLSTMLVPKSRGAGR